MGTQFAKCQCICNKDEQDTAQFYNNNNNIDSQCKIPSQQDIGYNENSTPTGQGGTYRSINGFNGLSPTSNSKELQDFIINKAKTNLERSTPALPNKITNNLKAKKEIRFFNMDYDIKKVIKIQASFQSFSLRKVFRRSLRTNLLFLTSQLTKNLIEQFTTMNLKRAETLVGTKYNPKGWKKFYAESRGERDPNLMYNYGRVFKTRLLVYTNPINAFYKGTVTINNERHGLGILLQEDGTKYEGYWRNDNFTGWGRYIDSNGNLYEGCFIDGKLNGKGIKRSLNGNIFTGEFVNSLREGRGKEETSEHIYEGEFSNDKKNGHGKLKYKILKDTYEGEFKDNCITGTGYYVWGNKDTYKGSFLNGKMHGKGLYKWPDGGEYYGEYVNGIKEGYGIFKWVNGKIYEGQFHDGKPRGIGKLKTTAKEIDVEFKEGKLSSCLLNGHF